MPVLFPFVTHQLNMKIKAVYITLQLPPADESTAATMPQAWQLEALSIRHATRESYGFFLNTETYFECKLFPGNSLCSIALMTQSAAL
jgi:hypothetical protein